MVVTVLSVALIAGCTGNDPDLPGLTATPSTEPPATTPIPTPTPAGARDLSDPELGIVFTDYPHDLDEQVVAAVEAYMLFETEFWRALTTNVVPPGPWVIASDDAIAWIQAQVGPNAAAGWVLDGTLRTSVAVAARADSRLSLDVCRNWEQTHFVEPATGDTATNDELDLAATSRVTLDLVNVEGTGWQVTAHELTGEC